MRRRLMQFFLLMLVAGALLFAAREVIDHRNRHAALPVVTELGGKIGSTPVWPFGNEYRISFHDVHLTNDDLRRLVVLNLLTQRHTIGIAFVDTNLTEDEIQSLRQQLPKCVIFRVVDGETIK